MWRRSFSSVSAKDFREIYVSVVRPVWRNWRSELDGSCSNCTMRIAFSRKWKEEKIFVRKSFKAKTSKMQRTDGQCEINFAEISENSFQRCLRFPSTNYWLIHTRCFSKLSLFSRNPMAPFVDETWTEPTHLTKHSAIEFPAIMKITTLSDISPCNICINLLPSDAASLKSNWRCYHMEGKTWTEKKISCFSAIDATWGKKKKLMKNYFSTAPWTLEKYFSREKRFFFRGNCSSSSRGILFSQFHTCWLLNISNEMIFTRNYLHAPGCVLVAVNLSPLTQPHDVENVIF